MSDANQLKAYLADRDVPCPGCGYNLRGVAKTVCPECSTELMIAIVSSPLDGNRFFARLLPWWHGLIGLILGVAFMGTLIVHPYYPLMRGWVLLTGLVAAVVPATIMTIVRSRDRRQTLPRSHAARLLILVLPVLIVAASAAVFFIWMP